MIVTERHFTVCERSRFRDLAIASPDSKLVVKQLGPRRYILLLCLTGTSTAYALGDASQGGFAQVFDRPGVGAEIALAISGYTHLFFELEKNVR